MNRNHLHSMFPEMTGEGTDGEQARGSINMAELFRGQNSIAAHQRAAAAPSLPAAESFDIRRQRALSDASSFMRISGLGGRPSIFASPPAPLAQQPFRSQTPVAYAAAAAPPSSFTTRHTSTTSGAPTSYLTRQLQSSERLLASLLREELQSKLHREQQMALLASQRPRDIATQDLIASILRSSSVNRAESGMLPFEISGLLSVPVQPIQHKRTYSEFLAQGSLAAAYPGNYAYHPALAADKKPHALPVASRIKSSFPLPLAKETKGPQSSSGLSLSAFKASWHDLGKSPSLKKHRVELFRRRVAQGRIPMTGTMPHQSRSAVREARQWMQKQKAGGRS